ncbi:MAG: 3'-5' exonuclease [Merdibacter sp.]
MCYRDMAVLYRSNYLSRALEKALLDAHIPYRIYGGIRFYERAEIKDALSYLRLLAPKQADDDKELWKTLAVRRVLNVPKRGIGAKSIDTLEQQAQQEDVNLYEVLKHPSLLVKGKRSHRGGDRGIPPVRGYAEHRSADEEGAGGQRLSAHAAGGQ